MSDDLEGDDIWEYSGDQGESKAEESKSQEEKESEQKDDDEEQKMDTEQEEPLEDDDTRHMTISELRQRIHLINNDIRIMKSDVQRITHESRAQRDRIRENQEKVKLNKQLPYLVANVVEVLEPDAEDGTLCKRLESNDGDLLLIDLCRSCLVAQILSLSFYLLLIS